METLRRVLAGAIALSWLAAAHAHAECVAPPPVAAGATTDFDTPGFNAPVLNALGANAAGTDAAAGQTQRDRRGRVVAPVSVNGEGPFRFIVDTGANRSALSPELAERLGLVADGEVLVHSIDGADQSPRVRVDSVSYQNIALSHGHVPVLRSPRVLAGEDGLLGVDGMQGRRLRMDFVRRCIEIVPSRGARPLNGWDRIAGELRFGSLVVVRGRIRNIDVNVLIDTGADMSLGNLALRDALSPYQVRAAELDERRSYTAGRPIVFENAAMIPQLEIGEIEITNLTMMLGDLHIFSLWGFGDEPTVLIGMDVLRQTQGIAIDYERATVHFRLPGRRYM